MSLLRSDRAAPPRTLVAILRETATRCPDDPAVDSGADVLTYSEMLEAAESVSAELSRAGVGPGDRVGVRIPSGTSDLYVAILGVLLAGASYVPVDADDPDSRARLVFDEAGVAALIGADLVIEVRTAGELPQAPADPGPEDDAWVIFTSGSTGRPKGVAVQHRSAAAFVDAESRLFLPDRPIGPGDRVMAGLSVAFDASCEEMWLAWGHGACLIPAPRSLVRSGMDLGPWMVANGITVVSTVPTLVALWPSGALAGVRLLILGGEACPPELAARLAVDGREVWNTYGPTEATVVACAARLDGDGAGRGSGCRSTGGTSRSSARTCSRSPTASRRADHRWRRAGPLPRPREGRREVRADADPRLGAGLPERRPGAERDRRAAVRGPRRRPGQAGRSPHRARRGGRRLLAVPGSHRGGRGGAPHGVRRHRVGRVRRRAGGLRARRRPGPPAVHAAGSLGAEVGGRRGPADADVREDRP